MKYPVEERQLRDSIRKLDVPEIFLNRDDLDLSLLYQRLVWLKSTGLYFESISQAWQITILGSSDTNYDLPENANNMLRMGDRTLFEYMALTGDLERIQKEYDEAFNMTTHEHVSLCHMALLNGSKKNYDWIRTNKRDFADLRDARQRSPFHYFGMSGKLEALDIMKKHHPEALELLDSQGKTPLHYAAMISSYEIHDWILKNCEEEILTKKDSFKVSIFDYMARSGNMQSFENIISHPGWILHSIDSKGTTLFHCLAEKNNPEAHRWLQKNCTEEELLQKNRIGLTPVHYLAASDDMDIFVWVMTTFQHQISTVNDEKYRTPMHYACETNNQAKISWMLEHCNSAGFHQEDKDSITPLHLMAKSCDLSNFKKSLERFRAEIHNSKDSQHRTPLYFAALGTNPEKIAFLLEKCPKIYDDLVDIRFKTPRDILLGSGEIGACKQLLKERTTFSFYLFEVSEKSIGCHTLLEILKTNYSLNSIQGFGKWEKYWDAKSVQEIKDYFERNNKIKKVKLAVCTLIQGRYQKNAPIHITTQIDKDFYLLLLQLMLPESVNAHQIYREIIATRPKEELKSSLFAPVRCQASMLTNTENSILQIIENNFTTYKVRPFFSAPRSLDDAQVDKCKGALVRHVSAGDILMAFIEIENQHIYSKKIRNERSEGSFDKRLKTICEELKKKYPQEYMLSVPFCKYLYKSPVKALNAARLIQNLIATFDFSKNIEECDAFREIQGFSTMNSLDKDAQAFYASVIEGLITYSKNSAPKTELCK